MLQEFLNRYYQDLLEYYRLSIFNISQFIADTKKDPVKKLRDALSSLQELEYKNLVVAGEACDVIEAVSATWTSYSGSLNQKSEARDLINKKLNLAETLINNQFAKIKNKKAVQKICTFLRAVKRSKNLLYSCCPNTFEIPSCLIQELSDTSTYIKANVEHTFLSLIRSIDNYGSGLKLSGNTIHHIIFHSRQMLSHVKQNVYLRDSAEEALKKAASSFMAMQMDYWGAFTLFAEQFGHDLSSFCDLMKALCNKEHFPEECKIDEFSQMMEALKETLPGAEFPPFFKELHWSILYSAFKMSSKFSIKESNILEVLYGALVAELKTLAKGEVFDRIEELFLLLKIIFNGDKFILGKSNLICKFYRSIFNNLGKLRLSADGDFMAHVHALNKSLDTIFDLRTKIVVNSQYKIWISQKDLEFKVLNDLNTFFLSIAGSFHYLLFLKHSLKELKRETAPGITLDQGKVEEVKQEEIQEEIELQPTILTTEVSVEPLTALLKANPLPLDAMEEAFSLFKRKEKMEQSIRTAMYLKALIAEEKKHLISHLYFVILQRHVVS